MGRGSVLSSPSSSTVARRSRNLWFDMPEALWWMSRRLALNLDRLKCRKRQRYVGKCGGKIEVELRIRLGGMEEEVKDTINVFGRLTNLVAAPTASRTAASVTWFNGRARNGGCSLRKMEEWRGVRSLGLKSKKIIAEFLTWR